MDRAETLAIEYFKKWATGQGGELKNTSREGVGYDFEVKWPSGAIEKFEVKGTRLPLKIPDMSIREFDDNKVLRADFIFVVGNVYEPEKEFCYKIPREALRSEHLKLKQTYHISRFQNNREMAKYRIYDTYFK